MLYHLSYLTAASLNLHLRNSVSKTPAEPRTFLWIVRTHRRKHRPTYTLMPSVLTNSPQEAAWWLRAGHLVIFPTETVYGLGCDAMAESAVAKVFEAKGRPADNPLIVHLADRQQIALVARRVPSVAQQLMEAFFPGPLTVILPKTDNIPDAVTGQLDTVAVRIPSLPVAQEFLRNAKGPVAAPSANLSSRPSTTTWQAAYEELEPHVGCVLCHDPATTGLESTVVDCTGPIPRLLRPGAVSLEDLYAVAPTLSAIGGHPHRSPGMRYRHYAPSAAVCIVRHPNECDSAPETAYIGITPPESGASPFGAIQICRSLEEYAHRLFAFFRRCEKRGIKRICCEEVSEEGLGRAIMDRLRRAATA
ncbi:MAG: L-threonylcarbamoyladenylate synthase [Bacteroidota bacterium]|nr:L-threonylcarbamoyladenylate synthase [Bacteroidota bacterium]